MLEIYIFKSIDFFYKDVKFGIRCLLRGITLRTNINFMFGINIRNYVFALHRRQKFCATIYYGRKNIEICLNVGWPQPVSKYFPTRFKILWALLVKITVISKIMPCRLVSSFYARKIKAWSYWITLKTKETLCSGTLIATCHFELCHPKRLYSSKHFQLAEWDLLLFS